MHGTVQPAASSRRYIDAVVQRVTGSDRLIHHAVHCKIDDAIENKWTSAGADAEVKIGIGVSINTQVIGLTWLHRRQQDLLPGCVHQRGSLATVTCRIVAPVTDVAAGKLAGIRGISDITVIARR